MSSRACPTPIGVLGLGGSDEGLRSLHWSCRGLELDAGCALLDEAAEQIDAYFEGRLTRFDLPLDLSGTDFQLACWHALAEIPYGSTVSYGAQARRLGFGPDAARAVGAANGQNPVPIVLPCHRVVGADGSLTGFGGGLALKQALLEHEARGLAGGAPVEPSTWPQAQLQLL